MSHVCCGQDNDSDYDAPPQEWGNNNYTCEKNQSQPAEQQDSDEASDEDYEQPDSEDITMPPHPPREAKVHDRHYRGNRKSHEEIAVLKKRQSRAEVIN